MASVNELNSFYQKFKCLVSSNVKASLKLDCENGKAVVSLTAELENIEKTSPFPPHSRESYASVVHKQNRSPSYFRRRQRRQEARQNNIGNVDAAHQETSAENMDTAAEEAADVVAVEEVNTQSLWAEKANVTDNYTEEVIVRGIKSLENYDTFIYTYRDNMKCSVADEAVDFIENSLSKNFDQSKVKVTDRMYQILRPRQMDENEIEIKLNLKKNNWLVERSARKIQMCTEDAPVYVSLKDIAR